MFSFLPLIALMHVYQSLNMFLRSQCPVSLCISAELISFERKAPVRWASLCHPAPVNEPWFELTPILSSCRHIAAKERRCCGSSTVCFMTLVLWRYGRQLIQDIKDVFALPDDHFLFHVSFIKLNFDKLFKKKIVQDCGVLYKKKKKTRWDFCNPKSAWILLG